MNSLLTRIKQRFCKHEWHIVWERDYKHYVLGEKVSPLRALNGSNTVKFCEKCGKAEHHIFVKSEEEPWANYYLVEHFEEVGSDGSE